MGELTGKKIEFISQEVDIVFQVASGVSTGTMFHDLLSNRDYIDQHPIAAIIGLSGVLGGKSDVGHAHAEYSPVSHLHTEYSLLAHGHTDYSLTAHTHTSGEVGLGNVDNTSDSEKAVSIPTQDALALKVDDTEISEIDNTSDADKPVSDAQQDALDLKVDIAGYFNFFEFNSTSGVDVLTDQPTYQEILRLTMTDLEAGKYATTITGRVQSDKVGKTVYIRWSVDGGASWDTPVGYNVLDAGEKRPFTIVEFDDFTAGGRVIIFEAAKDTTVTSMIINELSIACERKA